MLLKALLVAVLVYFVLKTLIRLVQAMKAGADPSPLDRESSHRWDGTKQNRSYADEDVEDAKFVDV